MASRRLAHAASEGTTLEQEPQDPIKDSAAAKQARARAGELSVERILGDPRALDEADEQRRLKKTGGHGSLVPYGAPKEDAEPVVLIHGKSGSPDDLAALISHFASDEKTQVYIFFYDDAGSYVERAGAELATQLHALCEGAEKKPRVKMLAHSMGGLIARCAMNSLANPSWLEPVTLPGGAPAPSTAEKFARVDMISIDTPWHGFGGPPFSARAVWPFENSTVDMIADSNVMRSVNKPPLPEHFSMQAIDAHQSSAGLEQDGIVGLCELDDEIVDRIIAFHARGDRTIFEDRKAKNTYRAMKCSPRYPDFLARVNAAVAEHRLTRDLIRRLFAEMVPQVAGSHTSVLDNPALVDAIRSLERK